MEILDYNMIEYHHHFGVGKDLLKWHMKHSRQGNIETTDNNKQWNKKMERLEQTLHKRRHPSSQ